MYPDENRPKGPRLRLVSLPKSSGKPSLFNKVQKCNGSLSTPVIKYERNVFEHAEKVWKMKNEGHNHRKPFIDIDSRDEQDNANNQENPLIMPNKKFDRWIFEKVDAKHTASEWIAYSQKSYGYFAFDQAIIEHYFEKEQSFNDFTAMPTNCKHLKVVGGGAGKREHPVQLADAKGRFKCKHIF